MDEYDYKLSRNNPVLTAKVLSTLVQAVQEKTPELKNKRQKTELLELKYLKDKCICGDPVICSIAAKGLIYLVKCGRLQVTNLMSDLIATIPLAKNHSGIILAITELLTLDLETKLLSMEYKCPFSLSVPQHPLISVLLHDPHVWVDIWNNVSKCYKRDDENSITGLNELFRPLYIYIFCDPFLKMPQLCRTKFFQFLVKHEHYNIHLLLDIMAWLQITVSENLVYTCTFIIDLINIEHIRHNWELREFLVIWLISVLYELILKKQNVIETITCISNEIQELEPKSTSVMLMMAANCIGIIPSVYLSDLLNLCLQLLKKKTSNIFVLQCVKASLLSWLLYPSILTEEASRLINTTYNYVDFLQRTAVNTELLHANECLSLYQNTNQHVHLAVELCVLSESWRNSDEDILNWLDHFNDSPLMSFRYLQTFICGIFLYEGDEKVTLKALSILLNYANINKAVTSSLLTLILYRLSSATSSKMQLHLLKALPRMGVVKENLHLIISTLKVLPTKSVMLRTLSMSLFYDLWMFEPKCYPYLQNLIVEEGKRYDEKFHITKARILKDLCIKKPELYGTELAAHLSKILNHCRSDSGTASALALEGLKHLCTEGVIDIVTAWETLAPSFDMERRTVVIKSFCNLMSEVPNLNADMPKYEQMVSQVVNKLWYYAMNSSDIEILECAYKSMSSFSVTDLSSEFPDIYRDVQMGEDTVTTLNSYNSVPGKWWLLVLQNGNRAGLTSAADLISALVSKEISEYSRGMYTVPASRGEPHNYNFLPEHSIVRALVDYIKIESHKFDDEVRTACLKILSRGYSKPLPPLDWCFLQELVHIPQLREYCISLASHQVVLSGTARRLMENFITAVTQNADNVEDITCVVRNLKHLCNSIQPVIIKPFLENSVKYALEVIKSKGDYSLFDDIIFHLKEVLVKDDMQESNRNVVAQVLVTILQQEFDISTKVFSKTLDCVTLVPFKYIKEHTCPKQWPDVPLDKFRRAVNIHCALARQSEEMPLVWLNEIIDVAGFLEEEQQYVLQETVNILRTFREHSMTANWVLELLGQIQVHLADAQAFTEPIPFMCEILTLSVVVFSGHDVLLYNKGGQIAENKISFMFPQALRSLLNQSNWNSYTSQILKWLYHLVNFEKIPKDYRTSFCQALIALRHEPSFKVSLKWMNYLGCQLKH